MKRTIIAFVVAPLWTLLAAELVACFSTTIPYEPAQIMRQAEGVFVATLVTYLGEVLLGVPAFLFLRSHKMTALWVGCIAGCIIGAVWAVVVTTYLLFSLGGTDAVEKAFSGNGNLIQMSLSPALFGSLIGATVWLIARPDKRADELETVGAC